MSMKSVLTVKSEDIGNRTLKFIASDDSPDRDGDRIMANGWVLENYKQNPLFLWNHNSSKPPIGKAIEGTIFGNCLMLEIQFAEKGVDYEDWPMDMPSPETAFKLYKGGYLNAVSVGFMPLEWKRFESPEERQRLGLGPWGTLYEKQELLELSSVTVPANPNALRLALSSGVIINGEEKFFKSREEILEEMVQTLSKSVADMVEMQKAMTKSASGAAEVRHVITEGTGISIVDSAPDITLVDFQKLWNRMGKKEILAELQQL